MLLVFAIHFLAASKDPNRMSIALCSGLAGGITFAGGIFRVFQADNYLASANSLRRAAFEMFHDSPLLGWGMDSFAQLLPFYADDTLLGTRHDRAVSDILQMLAEIGILGSLPLCILIAFLVIRYLKGQHDIHLTNHLLIGCVSCIALACFDSPFMSPAVCLSFWLIFFIAFRWGDLSRNRIDEVDAKPELVTHESKRRVPFHTQQYDEKLK
jgi:O-antigen ligase